MLPKWSAVPPELEGHATALEVVWMRSVVGCHWNPVKYGEFPFCLLLIRKLTLRISLASFTRSQSLSVKINADHQIFFSMRPLQHMVVIGLYKASADCKKRVIAYKVPIVSAFITIETDVLLTWRCVYERSHMWYADPHQTLLWSRIWSGSGYLHWT